MLKNKLLGTYKLPRIDGSDIVEPKLEIYEDRIELILGRKMFIDKAEWIEGGMRVSCHVKFCRKKFDYRDLILMNETLNRILGPKK